MSTNNKVFILVYEDYDDYSIEQCYSNEAAANAAKTALENNGQYGYSIKTCDIHDQANLLWLSHIYQATSDTFSTFSVGGLSLSPITPGFEQVTDRKRVDEVLNSEDPHKLHTVNLLQVWGATKEEVAEQATQIVNELNTHVTKLQERNVC